MWKEEISEDSNLWSCLGLWFPQLAFLKNASIYVFLSVTALLPTKAGYSVWSWLTGAGNGLLFWKKSQIHFSPAAHSCYWGVTFRQQSAIATPALASGRRGENCLCNWPFLDREDRVLKDTALHITTPPSLSSTPHLTQLPSRLPKLGLPKGGFSGPPPPTAAPACPFPVPLTSNSVFSTSNCSDSQLLLDFYNHLPSGLLTFCTSSSF